jgi:signal transduction histidine kinase
MERRKRAHYLVNKHMQLGVTFRFMMVTILFALFIGFEIYISIWPVVSEFVPREVMHLVRRQVLVRTALFLIPIILVIASFTIIISHRVAGPLFRIQRTIDDVVRGEKVEYINLRKKDELKGLAAKVNELIAVVQELRGSGRT